MREGKNLITKGKKRETEQAKEGGKKGREERGLGKKRRDRRREGRN